MKESIKDFFNVLGVIITIPIWMSAFIFMLLTALLMSLMDFLMGGTEIRYTIFPFLKDEDE